MELIFDKEKFLRLPLNDGYSVSDCSGGCIKQNFCEASKLGPCQIRIRYSDIGNYNHRGFGEHIRKSHPELCKLLDKYERKLMLHYAPWWGSIVALFVGVYRKRKLNQKFNENLKRDFLAELSEHDFVKFLDYLDNSVGPISSEKRELTRV